MNRQRVVIIIFLVAIFVVVPLIIWFVYTQSIVKTGVQFIVVPDNLLVKEGTREEKVNYEQIVSYAPGEHTFSLSAEGFSDKQYTVTVTEGQIAAVYTVLDPVSEAAQDYVSQPEIQTRTERIAGMQLDNGAQELENKYPFINKLPIIEKYFTIYPCTPDESDDRSALAVCITLLVDEPFYREAALQSLRDKGIDPTKITYRFSVQE